MSARSLLHGTLIAIGISLATGCASERALRLSTVREQAFSLYAEGEALEAAGRYHDALTRYTDAIDLSARPAFFYKAGVMHHKMGEPSRAVYFYDRALGLKPDYEMAQARRELALLEMKEEGLATRIDSEPDAQLRLASAAPSQPSAGARSAESLIESITPEQSRAVIFPEVVTPGSVDPAIERQRAREATQAGRWADAARIWGRITRGDNDNVTAHLELARALMRLGRTRSAIAEFSAAALTEPENPEVYLQWGNALASAGDPYMAEVRYRDCIEVDPENVRARNNIGAIYLQRGFPEESVNFLNEAIHLDPTFSPARLNLALALESLNEDRQMIIDNLEEYIRLDGARRVEAEAWLIRIRREGL